MSGFFRFSKEHISEVFSLFNAQLNPIQEKLTKMETSLDRYDKIKNDINDLIQIIQREHSTNHSAILEKTEAYFKNINKLIEQHETKVEEINKDVLKRVRDLETMLISFKNKFVGISVGIGALVAVLEFLSRSNVQLF